MRQLFEVGEVVIFKHNSQECSVFEVTYEKSTEITGREGLHAGFYYKVGVVGPNGNDKWAQSAFRKKYQPSEFSFNELMNNLKLPQKA